MSRPVDFKINSVYGSQETIINLTCASLGYEKKDQRVYLETTMNPDTEIETYADIGFGIDDAENLIEALQEVVSYLKGNHNE